MGGWGCQLLHALASAVLVPRIRKCIIFSTTNKQLAERVPAKRGQALH